MTGFKFPELEQLERIIERFGDKAHTQIIERIHYKGREFPIHCITLGSTQPDVPVMAFFGGVHGLEKIGSEVILSYMETISQLLDWDEEFLNRLEKSRLFLCLSLIRWVFILVHVLMAMVSILCAIRL